MSLLELVSTLANSINTAAARVGDTETFRCACDAITTWLAHAYQSGALSLLEVADHVARWQVISDWLANRVADGSMTVLQVAQVVASYIQHFGS
jgi:hypothetical protein